MSTRPETESADDMACERDRALVRALAPARDVARPADARSDKTFEIAACGRLHADLVVVALRTSTRLRTTEGDEVGSAPSEVRDLHPNGEDRVRAAARWERLRG